LKEEVYYLQLQVSIFQFEVKLVFDLNLMAYPIFLFVKYSSSFRMAFLLVVSYYQHAN